MNQIKNLIERDREKYFQFKPSEEFYSTVKINRKRWGLIFRGEIEPTVSEAKAIAEFFQFDVSEIFQ